MESETRTIRILATSDLHGKFMPWRYDSDSYDDSGSMAQLCSAVGEYRDDNTLLVDAGDSFQDNSAEIFLDADMHPMAKALNRIGYDAWVTGNHDFNFGMESLRKLMTSLSADVLCGNVYDPQGKPLAPGYVIRNLNGFRVAIIGMTSANIRRWDKANLKGWNVTDPLEETRKIISSIQGQYDALIGVFHMTINNEHGLPNSGVRDILMQCPEFDLMVSAHEHRAITDEVINGVLVVQNMQMAQTMMVIDMTFEKREDGWKRIGRTSQAVMIKDYEPDPEIMELCSAEHEEALADSRAGIGVLAGDMPLRRENDDPDICQALLEDSAMIALICDAMRYYGESDIAITAFPLATADANWYPGDIRKCDASLLYRFGNSLARARITGAQLKKFLEWTAAYYNTWHDGDQSVSFNPDRQSYTVYMSSHIHYEINLKNEPGHRIENLSLLDVTPIKDTDTFSVAVNDYCMNTLFAVGDIYEEEEECPIEEDSNIHNEYGGIRDMLVCYVRDVLGGVIEPETSHNWYITGIDWDEE